jgi:hypothetical protein
VNVRAKPVEDVSTTTTFTAASRTNATPHTSVTTRK